MRRIAGRREPVEGPAWEGPERRISNHSLDQLEIEIHREKVRVWVDGASVFLSDPKNVEVLTIILDNWLKARVKNALAGFGLASLGAMVLAGLAYFGWKGWAGPGAGK